MKEEALMLTQDQNIVDVQFAVQYTLKSPEEYLFNNRMPDEAVRQVAETAMREIVGRSKMDYVLYEGRGEIASRAKILMQKILDRYTTGIAISTVNLQNAQPPEQVQGSFDDAVRAKQDKERLKNEGEAYANDILPKARGLAARLLEEASGWCRMRRVIRRASRRLLLNTRRHRKSLVSGCTWKPSSKLCKAQARCWWIKRAGKTYSICRWTKSCKWPVHHSNRPALILLPSL
jgi:HflK protein